MSCKFYFSARLLPAACLFLLFAACNRQPVEPGAGPAPTADHIRSVGPLTLGRKLENPYSVANMRQAWENLRKANPGGRTTGEDIEITTTHLYVKFLPVDEAELEILTDDTTLVLYSHPLDHEISAPGEGYRDPDVPEGRPTYQYAAVPADRTLPAGVAHQILAELFIPDEEKDAPPPAPGGRRAPSAQIAELVEEALRLTGNLETPSLPGGRVNSSHWRPRGRVTVWDGAAGRHVPVVDVTVRARRWFTTHTGTTNANGEYSCDGTYRNPANYSLQWEKYHFSVRSGTFGQAEFDGPKTEGDWNPAFGAAGGTNVNDTQQYYALIFQAARD